MSISKFKQWLDEVDPYALQRITLYKCLFVATVEVYVYWLFQPVSFLAFFSPFFWLLFMSHLYFRLLKKKNTY